MNNERLMPSLVVFILIIMLITSGCGVPRNDNVNQNSNSNANSNSGSNSNSSGGLTAPSDICTGTPEQIAAKINTFLKAEIDDYTGSVPWRKMLTYQKLKGLFNYKAVVTKTPVYPTPTPMPSPSTSPSPAPTGSPTGTPTPLPTVNVDTVYLYISGGIGDDRKNGSQKYVFEEFLKVLKPLHLRNCINKVVLLKMSDFPTKTSVASEAPIDGFSWYGCDDPYVACPGGICAPPGTCW